MNEWQDMQKQPDTGMRDLLKRKKAKPRKLSELSKTEQNRLANSPQRDASIKGI